ncbi:hypothetical protein L798_14180 [Zootermopsis nevadensis]|uniref:Uncharacterized protein n=1 Tax=Zootermopsis nevadensis TaxID=136037 RepID=A0A067QQD8_ZOONE|nr:hypothetical protein L798_14180 [Zootermopsis nevadensis]
MSRYMRAKYYQNYKTRARMGRAQHFKENDTHNVAPGPKTNAQYCREYRQRKRSRTTQAASDEPASSIDEDFVADEMESVMEFDPDLSDPFGIPNMATGALNWTCIGADIYFKRNILRQRLWT